MTPRELTQEEGLLIQRSDGGFWIQFHLFFSLCGLEKIQPRISSMSLMYMQYQWLFLQWHPNSPSTLVEFWTQVTGQRSRPQFVSFPSSPQSHQLQFTRTGFPGIQVRMESNLGSSSAKARHKRANANKEARNFILTARETVIQGREETFYRRELFIALRY